MPTGLLKGANVTTGPANDFLAVEREVLFGIVPRLGLHLSVEDKRRLAVGRTTDVDAFRLLRETEQERESHAPSLPPPEHDSRHWPGTLHGPGR